MSAIRIKSLIAAIVFSALTILLITGLTAKTAHADTAPKPSVNVAIENVGDTVCYGTLLSKYDTTGPQSAWDGDPEHIDEYLDRDIWQAFVDYEDCDGYWFLQTAWLCTDTQGIDWNYYPPNSFKILLYFPEAHAYAASGIYERYAFNSYYTVTLDGAQISAERTASITAKKSYDYGGEIFNLLLRVIITIAIELCVALLFRFTEKRRLLAVLCVNTVTQLILNIILNLVNFYNGVMFLMGAYLLGELIVFILEATAYSIIFSNARLTVNGQYAVSKSKCVAYAFVANAASFLIGAGIFFVRLIFS